MRLILVTVAPAMACADDRLSVAAPAPEDEMIADWQPPETVSAPLTVLVPPVVRLMAAGVFVPLVSVRLANVLLPALLKVAVAATEVAFTSTAAKVLLPVPWKAMAELRLVAPAKL